jgi:hypothetical protein
MTSGGSGYRAGRRQARRLDIDNGLVEMTRWMPGAWW